MPFLACSPHCTHSPKLKTKNAIHSCKLSDTWSEVKILRHNTLKDRNANLLLSCCSNTLDRVETSYTRACFQSALPAPHARRISPLQVRTKLPVQGWPLIHSWYKQILSLVGHHVRVTGVGPLRRLTKVIGRPMLHGLPLWRRVQWSLIKVC